MSLVGFKAQNHHQQVLVHGARSHVDDRALTTGDFDRLNERFGFTIDIAASDQNAKLGRYLTAADDALSLSWERERVYCNPPYSSIEPWVEKAHREAPRCPLIVMLLPANRTEQGWWQRQVEQQRRAGALAVEFLPGRIRFLKPGQQHIAPNERPPFGCCLLIWGS